MATPILTLSRVMLHFFNWKKRPPYEQCHSLKSKYQDFKYVFYNSSVMKQVMVINARIVLVANVRISSVRTQCSYVNKIRDGLNLNWGPKMNQKDCRKYLLHDTSGAVC